MTSDDLRRLQDNCLQSAQRRLLENGHLAPVGFVVTLTTHLDKLLESGWGIEFLDPKQCLSDAKSDGVIITLVVDLLMNPERLYHAVLRVFPNTRQILPQMISLGTAINVDDTYARVMRAFLEATQLDPKDIIAATLRQICDQVSAFACILCSGAWMRDLDSSNTAAVTAASHEGLAHDQKAVEVIFCAMETHDFTRMVTVPIRRQKPSETARRDEGKVLGFGKVIEGGSFEGRMSGFLKPLGVAS